jgi:hypothetical protein
MSMISGLSRTFFEHHILEKHEKTCNTLWATLFALKMGAPCLAASCTLCTSGDTRKPPRDTVTMWSSSSVQPYRSIIKERSSLSPLPESHSPCLPVSSE